MSRQRRAEPCAGEHPFDRQSAPVTAASPTMRTIRTWRALRREGRGLSLWAVARGWS